MLGGAAALDAYLDCRPAPPGADLGSPTAASSGSRSADSSG